jgi:hypothetical protein
MADRIKTYSNDRGVCYRASKQRLVNAGLATVDMFPERSESWRGNGLCRDPDELLWSVQRTGGRDYIVMWGVCAEAEPE